MSNCSLLASKLIAPPARHTYTRAQLPFSLEYLDVYVPCVAEHSAERSLYSTECHLLSLALPRKAKL